MTLSDRPFLRWGLMLLAAVSVARADLAPALRRQFFAAAERHDDGELTRLRGEIVAALGKQAGVPETGLRKYVPIDTAPPSLAHVCDCWTNTLRDLAGRYPWQNEKSGRRPRPRAIGRWVRALYLTGAADKTASAGAEALLAIQGTDGVFGFPVPAPGEKGRLAVSARRLVSVLEKRGRTVIEKGYIVQDGGTGELNFDNGEAAMALLTAYAATGNTAWLEAARRAGEWGLRQPLVPNWNYNCFHGWLAARLYRITGETPYLEASVALLRYGVLAGQMDDGNWFDAHNASAQYRAVMIRACLELHLALKGSGHPYAAELEQRTRRACDALARQTLEWGFDASKAWEALPVDTFSLALMAFGPDPFWERALNVEINGLLARHPRPLPESVATYLLYRSGRREPVVPTK